MNEALIRLLESMHSLILNGIQNEFEMHINQKVLDYDLSIKDIFA